MADLPRIFQRGLAQECENSAPEVVFQAVTKVKQVGKEAIGAGLRPTKIKYVKGAAWFEDAQGLMQVSAPARPARGDGT